MKVDTAALAVSEDGGLSQLITQMPSMSAWSIQSLGLPSLFSPGAGSHLERPLGPWCFAARTYTSLKLNRRMAAIQWLMVAFSYMSGLLSMPLINWASISTIRLATPMRYRCMAHRAQKSL